MTIDFPSAFSALTNGKSPFRWQQRLFADIVRGDIPDACDIPTGLGKTSVMAIWLAALDLGDRDIRLPRRLIYVVDRRAVVDQATEEAEQLAKALGDGTAKGTDPVIATLRERLRLGANRSLPISTLRGQLADNRIWLEDPSAPAIVVGTVDMIGSRLLFQGYGVSARMRPVHAALLGADALVVLDEAHLVPPLEALVRKVAALTVEDGNRAPFRVPELCAMTLSATGRGAAKKTFTLQPKDEKEDDVVRKRLNASKWLNLQGLPTSANLAETMAQLAWERGQGGRRIIVFCDSRKVAQAVYDDIEKKLGAHLKEHFGKEAPKSTDFIQLMVGARRVREREELARSKTFKRFSPKSAEDAAAAEMPAFLVATSAGEVGLDIDADHMICDLVAWERMVQRLGRVNRLGQFKEGSLVDVFAVSSDKDKEAETPAGTAQIETWRAPFDSALWPTGQNGRRDASPGALRRLRNNEDFKKLADDATTPEPLRPNLTRALIDAWSMTSLDEHPGRPNVTPWIRGWVDDEPQTRIVWRRHLPIRINDRYEVVKGAIGEFFEAAPPHLSEVLETYTYSVVELMRARVKALLKGKENEADAPEDLEQEQLDASDGAEKYEVPETRMSGGMFVVAVLTPGRKIDRLLRLREIEDIDAKRLYAMVAGRTVIVDARMGGLADTGLLDAKEHGPPATLDEKPFPALRAAFSDEEMEDTGPKRTWLWDDERLQEIGFRVGVVPHKFDSNTTWKPIYRRFMDPRVEEADDVDSFKEWRVEDWVGDGMARNESALAGTNQTIDPHHVRTKFWAEKIASRLGLPDQLRVVLTGAASVHDLGKARRNWQAYAGNPGFARRHAPLAKFTKKGNPNLLKIGEATYRHEFGSLRDAMAEKAFDGAVDDFRDLALHMIAAHHGNARPVIAPVDELDPPTVSRELARQAALRFARLQKQWGPWGLAWCEALLRAADVTASREVAKPEEES
jgi:CRISPR-associated endonuclease/helicase Cas3